MENKALTSLRIYRAALVAVILINAVTLIYIFPVRLLDRQYNRAFAQANILASHQVLLSDLAFAFRGDITWRTLGAHHLFVHDESRSHMGCGITFRGQHQDFTVETADVTFSHPLDTHDAKRKMGFLSGVLIRIGLPQPADGDLLFFRGDRFANAIDFAHNAALVEVSGHPEDEWAQALTAFVPAGMAPAERQSLLQMFQPLIERSGRSEAPLAAKIDRQHLLVFLQGRSLTPKAPLLMRLDRQLLEHSQLPELALSLDIAKRICARPTHSSITE
jgi:hypothetical protein